MLGKALDTITKAGEILKKYWNVKLNIETKLDGSVVTDADKEVNTFLTQNLREAYSVPVVSEESIPDWAEREKYRDYWLIDPLDGTLEFIHRFGDFCICAAYMRNRRPLCGIVFAPALDELYLAISGDGARFYQAGKKNKLTPPTNSNLIVAKSRFHNERTVDEFCAMNNVDESMTAGGAIKFGRIALGTITVYPRYSGPKEWDVAAGDIIVWESGGRMVGMQTNKAMMYNNEDMRVEPFIAYGHGVALREIKT
jgi:3'(2'), 5'-bisphosphate nucleotidase